MSDHARKISPALDKSVRHLGFKDYYDYLDSDHWRRFRDVYERSTCPQECLCCGARSYCLHHISYKRLGREELEDVIPLCRYCHHEVHESHRRYKIPLINYKSTIQAVKIGVPSPDDRPRKPPKLTKKNSTKSQRRALAKRRKVQCKEEARRRQKLMCKIKTVEEAQAAGALLVVRCGVCNRDYTQSGPFCCMCGGQCSVLGWRWG